ncbi:MAG: sigma-70 family RNA polymerase sigma factor, partial [Longimicrobiales bacterium]|nr:sigma-70 family RNA polymerase sigma factor [Longimicrobiales bacterium]
MLRARDGDGRAYGLLVQRYKRAAYAVALSVTKHHENAEDVAQTAFLVALRRLEDCRDPERFGGWVLSIVRNRARNLLRRESVRVTEEIPESAGSRLPGPERVYEQMELRGFLEEA